MQPFSLTMSVYINDTPKDVKTAFESIISNTIIPAEIVITIDGPITEDLEKLIATFQEYKIVKIVRLSENKGQGIAHAIGVEQCNNELIAIMDSDDICVSTRFEQQLVYFDEHPETDILGGQISEFVDSPSNIVGIRNVPLENYNIKKYFKKRCPMNHMTIMFKKSVVLKNGNYQDWHYNEDYFLYCRLYKAQCIFANLPETLVLVRVGTEMYKRRGGFKYFQSEAKLQWWMLIHKIISFPRYCINVIIRFFIQVLIPTEIRSFIFKKFFRDGKKI